MAESEDGPQNSKNCEKLIIEGLPDDNEQTNAKPDLGADEPQKNSNENSTRTSKENEGCSSSKFGFFILFLRAKFKVIP